MSITRFTKGGDQESRRRLRRHMRKAVKGRRAVRAARRSRRDLRTIKHLHQAEPHIQKEIENDLKFFLADKTVVDEKERIDMIVEEHKLIAEIDFFANAKENMILKKIVNEKDVLENLMSKVSQSFAEATGAVGEQAPKALAKNPEFQKEINSIIANLNDIVEKSRKIISNEVERARDLVHDRQKMGDRSFLPFAIIYYKLRHANRADKKDTKGLMALFNDVEHLVLKMKSDDVKDLKKHMKQLEKYLRKEKDLILDDFRNLAQIEGLLTVTGFRENLDEDTSIIARLKNMNFPEMAEEELKNYLFEARKIVDELHDKGLRESRLTRKTARKTDNNVSKMKVA